MSKLVFDGVNERDNDKRSEEPVRAFHDSRREGLRTFLLERSTRLEWHLAGDA